MRYGLTLLATLITLAGCSEIPEIHEHYYAGDVYEGDNVTNEGDTYNTTNYYDDNNTSEEDVEGVSYSAEIWASGEFGTYGIAEVPPSTLLMDFSTYVVWVEGPANGSVTVEDLHFSFLVKDEPYAFDQGYSWGADGSVFASDHLSYFQLIEPSTGFTSPGPMSAESNGDVIFTEDNVIELDENGEGFRAFSVHANFTDVPPNGSEDGFAVSYNGQQSKVTDPDGNDVPLILLSDNGNFRNPTVQWIKAAVEEPVEEIAGHLTVTLSSSSSTLMPNWGADACTAEFEAAGAELEVVNPVFYVGGLYTPDPANFDQVRLRDDFWQFELPASSAYDVGMSRTEYVFGSTHVVPEGGSSHVTLTLDVASDTPMQTGNTFYGQFPQDRLEVVNDQGEQLPPDQITFVGSDACALFTISNPN